MKLGDLIKPKQYALEVLDMFLHKQCDLERTKFAYSQNEVFEAVKMSKEALEELEQYRSLGTVEELKEEREKQKSRREWYQKGYQDGLNAEKWIPVEEGLPSKDNNCLNDMVLVTLENGDVCLGVYRDDIDDYGVWLTRMSEGEIYYTKKHDVIAWQPLPAPYKKEGADDGL